MKKYRFARRTDPSPTITNSNTANLDGATSCNAAVPLILSEANVAASTETPTVKTPLSSPGVTSMNAATTPARKCITLGRGCFSPEGILVEEDPPEILNQKQVQVATTTTKLLTTTTATPTIAMPRLLSPKLSLKNLIHRTTGDHGDEVTPHSILDDLRHKVATTPKFLRRYSSFLRVSDLGMSDKASVYTAAMTSRPSSVSEDDNNVDNEHSNHHTEAMMAHYHYVSSEPPPGCSVEHNEHWVALDNGAGSQSPMAVAAVTALEQFGREEVCFNKEMWTAERGTDRINSKPSTSWQRHTFELPGLCPPVSNDDDKDTILMWSGKILHGFYGNDFPLVRAAGIINASPQRLVELLLDSDRVKQYNEMSLGRTDLLILQNDMNPSSEGDDNHENSFGGVTKIVQSQSRPPMLRKTIQCTSLMHARPLPDQSGYSLITRAITVAPPDHHNTSHSSLSSPFGGGSSNGSIVTAEILNGINILKSVEGNPNQCLFIAVNHVRSPLLPMMLARRVGLQAVVSFIQDVRKCCATAE